MFQFNPRDLECGAGIAGRSGLEAALEKQPLIPSKICCWYAEVNQWRPYLQYTHMRYVFFLIGRQGVGSLTVRHSCRARRAYRKEGRGLKMSPS